MRMPRQKGSEEKDAGEAGEIPIDQRVHGIDGSAGKKGNGADSKNHDHRLSLWS